MKKSKIITIIILAIIVASFSVGCSESSHQHSFKWYIIKQATCQEEGQMEGICQDCGHKEYNIVEKSSHEYNWTIDKTPTCTEVGKSTGYCVICYNKTENVIKTIEHKYENGICVDCDRLEPTVYLQDGQKLGYTLAEIDKLAEDKGFKMQITISEFIKEGGIINLRLNGKKELVASSSAITINLGDLRVDFKAETGITDKVYAIRYEESKYRLHVGLYVYYVDGSAVKVSDTITDNMSIAVNKENELLIVLEDRSVVKYGVLSDYVINLSDDALLYELDSTDTYYTVCGVVDKTIEEISIPETHKGKPVKSIGYNAFYACGNLKTVKLNSAITAIGAYAFMNCVSLEKIVIPTQVTTMGSKVFINCNKLNIYCKSKSKPSTWSTKWNDSNLPVVWGYKG